MKLHGFFVKPGNYVYIVGSSMIECFFLQSAECGQVDKLRIW
jgi:hypothetical protein